MRIARTGMRADTKEQTQIGTEMDGLGLPCEYIGTNVMKLSHSLHANNLLNALNESRKNPALCDGLVLVENSEVPVQKNVLAACSPYFRAVYQYESKDKSVICLNHLSPSVFGLVLDYIYTSEIVLCEENIQDVLQASDLLLLMDLKELCCDYLEQCLSAVNCLGIIEFSDTYSCLRVLHTALDYLDEHFNEVRYTEEYVMLPVHRISQILKRASLKVSSENIIIDSLFHWANHDPHNRTAYLKEIMRNSIQLSRLNYEALHVPSLDGMNRWDIIRLMNEIQKEQEDQETKLRGYSNVVVMAGGEGPCLQDDSSSGDLGEVKRTVSFVVPHESQCQDGVWIDLPPMLSPRVNHGLVEAGGCLFVVGGRDHLGHILNSGEKYDPATNQWTAIPPMSHARVGFGLVAIDDKIYAIGGSNDMSDPMICLEEFCIYTNKWRTLPEMSLKRAWSAYAVVNKKIYVIGGGIMGKLYEAVECFDPKRESWTSVAPMKERRFDARAVGVGDNVFVFGGLRRLECPSAMHHGSGMKFCGTEVFTASQKLWSTMMSASVGMCTMSETSHIDSALNDKDEIYIMGDLDTGDGSYNFLRALNLNTNRWRPVIGSRPSWNRSNGAMCMLKLSNAFIRCLEEHHEHLKIRSSLPATV